MRRLVGLIVILACCGGAACRETSATWKQNVAAQERPVAADMTDADRVRDLEAQQEAIDLRFETVERAAQLPPEAHPPTR